ncbi:PD40 domain-containing protein [bacterium]|nr:PD40 domain-containing protein [bacterium]
MSDIINLKYLSKSILVSLVIVLLTHSSLLAVIYGKNNVQYTHFRWKYLTTEHFNIYYNQGGREIADFTAEVAEEAYRDIARTFQYSTKSNDPITIVTYQSHNDFEQTNVTSQPDESTGGVTEFLKTRIVIPFQGDHEEFRHVIHHELTHAMMLNMLYGQGFAAIMSGISQSRLPLWFIEGLAEYMSHGGLDPETEMFLRDAVVNDNLPEISRINEYGYLGVYKSGQSILYWIAWRYGEEKIGEILHQTRNLGDFNRAIKASIGVDLEELSKRWQRYIKERYWAQIADMEPPDRMSRQLTDHVKEYCYVNNSPSLSPNGEWLAFLTNRSDYFDIYLMNTLDGEVHKRLVRGQRSGKFEELHWLRPGITWSPDGKQIALCSKSGERDVLYLISVPDGKIKRTFEFQADGLFSPSWSPNGEFIAMILVHDGWSDIVIVELKTGQLQYVTNDIFDEADPSWSGDSKRLLFTSNRGSAGLRETLPGYRTMSEHNYHEFDIFEVNLENRLLKRFTNDPFVERTPLWSPEANTILYVSDRSGIYNIYVHDVLNQQSYTLSNIVTGTFQPTIARNAETIAFTSYFNNGYDIFLMNDPFREYNRAEVLEIPKAEKIHRAKGDSLHLSLVSANYEKFIFDRLFHTDEEKEFDVEDSTETEIRARLSDGRYPSKDYQVELKPDLVLVNASYSPYHLLQGSGLLLLTDVLGNHQLYLSLDLNQSAEYSNIFFMYNYLARRVNIGGGVYHYSYPYYDSSNKLYWLDRNYGVFVSTSYPLNRYNRLDFGLDYSIVDRSVHSYSSESAHSLSQTEYKLSSVLPSIGYVHDTSVWRWSTSPANGGRWRVDFTWSPYIGKGSSGKGVDFKTVSADWRRYYAYHKDYTFGFRLSGAISEGKNPQRFFLGGMTNWFNYRFDNQAGRVTINMEDIYFSRFVTPLRGVGFYNQVGNRYLLGNFEFRFPFIRHLVFGWPLPVYFRNIRGILFSDIGTAWYSGKQFSSSTRDENGERVLDINQYIPGGEDWSSGYGFGIRFDLGIFPIEWDIAWSHETDMIPQYYFSLNYGF